jgi:integrase/recombinase XerC
MTQMLTLYRRHESDCQHADKGTAHAKCTCPVWCDGYIDGKRVRKSLKTRDWARAKRIMAGIETDVAEGRERKTVTAAADLFIESLELAASSLRKYRHRMECLIAAFPEGRHVDEITLPDLDAYRRSRRVSGLTWSKELETLRSFWSFCVGRKWCEENIAKALKAPRNVRNAKERIPYTAAEKLAIREACRTAGNQDYERRRWLAIVLLQEYYGLRVSDAALFARKRIVGDAWVLVRQLKNSKWVRLPLYPEVREALARVPLPDSRMSPYYFWTGSGKIEHHVNNTIMSLACVFRESGVKDASSHRYRHTLATELLTTGATIEDVALILGDKPETIRKHYAHYTEAYEGRAAELLSRVHGENSPPRKILSK